MDLDQMIGTLKSERDALDAAILVLERLATTQRRRRGRPPAWMQIRREEVLPEREAKRTRRMSEETKKKMAEAQKKRWAAFRKEKHT
jgi:hypothetical protein